MKKLIYTCICICQGLGHHFSYVLLEKHEGRIQIINEQTCSEEICNS